MSATLRKLLPSRLKDGVRGGLSHLGPVLQRQPAGARFLSDPNNHLFFGYYDVTPFSADDRYLLAGRAACANISPHDSHPELEVGYFDLAAPEPVFIAIGTTKSWNWQQGCRLQWYPRASSGGSQRVIYNTIHDGRYAAVIQNPFNPAERRFLPCPVYSVSPDGARAVTLDFGRLHEYRPGYGYNNLPERYEPDGIRLLDIPSGSMSLIATVDSLRAHEPLASMEGATHYLNHLCFAPSGRSFMVTHLWLKNGKRCSRILILDLEGNVLACPNNEGKTSHYCWIDDRSLLAFAAHDGRVGYYRYDIRDNAYRPIRHEGLREDGHPTFIASPGGHSDILVTDRYPDPFRLQPLLVYQQKYRKVKTLGTFYAPPDYTGEVRCDLHPRLSNGCDKICVDAVRHGRRALCLLPVTGK